VIIRPEVGTTSTQSQLVGWKSDRGDWVVKVYFSPKLNKIRIALPELQNFAQVKIDVDNRLIDFERDPVEAKRGVEERERKAKGFKR